MNATEAGQLLAFAALFDNRKTSDPDVMAWLKAIGDLPYADCETAVADHYGQSTDRVMPGHIRTRVKAMRASRLSRTPLPAPPPELADNPGRYRSAIVAGLRRIADGMDVHKAISAPLPGDPPDEWQKAKAAITPEPSEVDKQEMARQQAAESRRQRAERAEREAAKAGEAAAS